jgi:hypothetical protein
VVLSRTYLPLAQWLQISFWILTGFPSRDLFFYIEKIKKGGSLEPLAPIYQTTRHNIVADYYLNIHQIENIKPTDSEGKIGMIE